MIDFHSHILPDIDDGSASIEESLKMLRVAKENDVDIIVLTPHCYYADDGDIREFIRKRNEQYRLLKAAIKSSGEDFPELRLGCELHLNRHHEDSAFLNELAIEGTDFIMLEMPMRKWEPDIYDTIYSITLTGLTPIMAHIDRYLPAHKKDFVDLFSLDLAYQVNCDSFLMPGIRKEIPWLFENGAIHILGSDMHNMTTRTNNMAECKKQILAKYGKEYLDFIERNSKNVIENHKIENTYFKKMGFFKKMTL